MADSSGNSTGSTRIQSGGSEDGLIDDRKRKRMQSNRESARRSRMRKQKHIDDMLGEAARIKIDTDQIRTTINVTTQRFVEIEAENAVLNAQVNELSQRLNSLNEIISYMNTTNASTNNTFTTNQCTSGTNGLFEFDMMENNTWNMMYANQQPIMACAADMFGY
ncbi:bZIP transcription factor 11-like protein [Tanacetum coccineum]